MREMTIPSMGEVSFSQDGSDPDAFIPGRIHQNKQQI
jgi:hypothetical protein